MLRSFRGGIDTLERLAAEERLFVVKVDDPPAFDPDRFVAFLGAPPTTSFLDIVRDWQPINDLAYQKEKWGEEFTGEVDVPDDLADVRRRHPWISEVEARYDAVWRRCR